MSSLSEKRAAAASTAYPMYFASGSAFAAAVHSMKKPLGYPGYVPLMLSSGILALFGWNMHEDKQYGQSSAMGISLIYVAMFGEKAVRSFRLGPIGMMLVAAGTAAVYAPETYQRHFG